MLTPPIFELTNIPFRLNEESEGDLYLLRMDFMILKQEHLVCADIGKILCYQTDESQINIMITCSATSTRNGIPFIGFFREVLPEITYQL